MVRIYPIISRINVRHLAGKVTVILPLLPLQDPAQVILPFDAANDPPSMIEAVAEPLNISPLSPITVTGPDPLDAGTEHLGLKLPHTVWHVIDPPIV